jgi:uncharacterized protein YhdP
MRKTKFWKSKCKRTESEILGDLADYLPISPALREEVSRASPRGDMRSLLAQWSGEWMTPVVFNVKGSFANLSMRQTRKFPSFSGITGNIDATEKGGTLNLSSRHAKVELSDVFKEPVMLDALTGQASWSLLLGTSLTQQYILFQPLYRRNGLRYLRPEARRRG